VEGLLVADYVNPKMADKLRQQQVQFIDTAGNAFINQPPVYVYVTGKRQEERGFMPIRDGAKRAFEPKGLMVIYAFLCHPELVNAPYRKIAEQAGVAVGTVGWVLNGLKAADFICDRGGKQGRRLARPRLLRDARLRKATEWIGDEVGSVLIYRPSWPEPLDEPGAELREGLVHPILAYADLVATGESMNLDVAGRLYDEHIAQLVRED